MKLGAAFLALAFSLSATLTVAAPVPVEQAAASDLSRRGSCVSCHRGGARPTGHHANADDAAVGIPIMTLNTGGRRPTVTTTRVPTRAPAGGEVVGHPAPPQSPAHGVPYGDIPPGVADRYGYQPGGATHAPNQAPPTHASTQGATSNDIVSHRVSTDAYGRVQYTPVYAQAPSRTPWLPPGQPQRRNDVRSVGTDAVDENIGEPTKDRLGRRRLSRTSSHTPSNHSASPGGRGAQRPNLRLANSAPPRVTDFESPTRTAGSVNVQPFRVPSPARSDSRTPYSPSNSFNEVPHTPTSPDSYHSLRSGSVPLSSGSLEAMNHAGLAPSLSSPSRTLSPSLSSRPNSHSSGRSRPTSDTELESDASSPYWDPTPPGHPNYEP